MIGLDLNGGNALIIERKLWANLTHNQPANYLKELTQLNTVLSGLVAQNLNS